MFTMAMGLRGQAKHQEQLPVKAVRCAALLGMLILVSIAVNALTIYADAKLRQRSSGLHACAVVAESAGPACHGPLVGLAA
jgi:hypothetical protein